jgi:hypothetical protein
MIGPSEAEPMELADVIQESKRLGIEKDVVAALELGDGALGHLQELGQLGLRLARDLLPKFLKRHLKQRLAHASIDALAGFGAHLVA